MTLINAKYWADKRVAITGGASFIGSHLVDELVKIGANVTVVDDFSSGRMENLSESIDKVQIVKLDLEWCSSRDLVDVFHDKDIVFHLAATHGGRGYIDTHPADVCSNLAIDHHVFEASMKSDVSQVVSASSACVYPPKLQEDVDSNYLLKETDTDVSMLGDYLSADLEYGWAKVMGEMQSRAFYKQYGLKSANVRFVTAYGPRENETHAIIALIYKAFLKMDPYVIWGTGEQDRDFTYVTDIAEGTILAAENIHDGKAVNLGTGKRYKLKEVAEQIFTSFGWHPKKMVFDTSKPTGVASRALDINLTKELTGWEPKVSLSEGLTKTIDWYVRTHSSNDTVNEKLLMER